MRHLVIGLGEVGNALRSILNCDGYDPKVGTWGLQETYDMIHICFPFSKEFLEQVREYIRQFKPMYTVVHSTVPIGTCSQLSATHSPVRGKHPDLEKSMRTFVKYVSGDNAKLVAIQLSLHGIPAQPLTLDSDTTEAAKLIDLMQYGVSILLEKEIHKFCEEHALDFDTVYTEFNHTYNDGYRDLGLHQFTRPVLEHTDGPIGGHCVVPMMSLLPMESAWKIIQDNKKL